MPTLLQLVKLAILGATALTLVHCTSPSRPGLPPGSPFAPVQQAEPSLLEQGVATGDVTSTSAALWFRTERAAKVRVEWGPGRRSGVASRVLRTVPDQDFTVTLPIASLQPATEYRYRVQTLDERGEPLSEAGAGFSAEGRFTTAPPNDRHDPVTFVWGGDLGGQGFCRRPQDAYGILDVMLDRRPDFAILLGDLIYADGSCASPPNAPGSEFKAGTLDEFRQKHRYQRGAPALRRFLAHVPVYAIWDDHEVRNNFSGPYDPLMPIGRRALLEYWPVARHPADPFRLYRNFRYGADLELFILDTRQYRDRNGDADGPGKTMLGLAQREWLVEGLSRSTATWKVVASSVPLSLSQPGSPSVPGNDSWARSADGRGFLHELSFILQRAADRSVRNLVWLVGDVHFAQVNAYDPDHDDVPDFYEFISGPLSAVSVKPRPPQTDLSPTTFYIAGGFPNYGDVEIDGTTLRVTIRDRSGEARFTKSFQAR